MRKQQIVDYLKELGLSPSEAAIYQAALASGPSTVVNIAKTAGVKRTTVYSVIEDLMKSGLMTIEMNGFKKLYSPASPDKLENILERRREMLHKMLPELSAMYNLKGGESFIKYYAGLPAIKALYNSLIAEMRPGDPYDVISDSVKWFALDKKFFDDFVRRRASMNIPSRLLLQDSEVAREEKKFERQFGKSVKILPENSGLEVNLIVTPYKAVVHQLVEPVMAIVIETKSVIHLHQKMFDLIWNSIPDQN